MSEIKWTVTPYQPHKGPLPSGEAEVVLWLKTQLSPEDVQKVGSLVARCIKAEEEVKRLQGVSDALMAVNSAMCFDSRDWSVSRRDAFLYGIVVGWGEALPEVARRHKWDAETVSRVQRFHAAVDKVLRGDTHE